MQLEIETIAPDTDAVSLARAILNVPHELDSLESNICFPSLKRPRSLNSRAKSAISRPGSAKTRTVQLLYVPARNRADFLRQHRRTNQNTGHLAPHCKWLRIRERFFVPPAQRRPRFFQSTDGRVRAFRQGRITAACERWGTVEIGENFFNKFCREYLLKSQLTEDRPS